MASMAEQSVPMSQLQRCRDELLNLHALPQRQSQAQIASRAASPIADDASVSPNKQTTHREIDNVSAPTGVYHTPTSSPVRTTIPRLQGTKSAPDLEMEPVASSAKSQDAIMTFANKAATFHAREYGDTQPMESQVYRQLSQSMVIPNSTPQKLANIEPTSPETHNTNATGQTPCTLREGDPGYVDFTNAIQPSSPGQSDFDDLLNEPSPQTQFQIPARPGNPQTPALAGQKHGRNGEMLTSGTSNVRETPAYSQLFALPKEGNLLSATQMFNQTQAPSSPLPVGLRSDPIMTRPSPDVDQRAISSPPPVVFSSPVAALNVRPLTASGQPRENYTSMRESQDRRHAKLREELGFADDEEEDLLGFVQPGFERPTPRRAWSMQPISSTRRAVPSVNLVTPGTHSKGELLDFDDGLSEDEPGDEGHVESPIELIAGEDELDGMAIEEYADMSRDQNEDDEYDELGQTVLRSQSNPQEEHADDQGDDDQGLAFGSRSGAEDEHGNRKAGNTTVSERAPTLEQHGPSATQKSAIADSQSIGRSARVQPSLHERRIAQQSLMSSFVPGSQYAGRTSQDEASLRSQRATWLEAGRDIVLSSPPLPRLDNVHSGVPKDEALNLESELSGRLKSRHITRDSSTAPQEVPESDLTDHHTVPAMNELSRETGNSAALFSTAQTHVSSSGPSPVRHAMLMSPGIRMASQQSRVSQFSPRRAAHVKGFAEIEANLRPSHSSGDIQVDIDAVMNSVITAEDKDILAALSDSPRPRKTRGKVRTALPQNSLGCSRLSSSLKKSSNLGKQTSEALPVRVDVSELAGVDASASPRSRKQRKTAYHTIQDYPTANVAEPLANINGVDRHVLNSNFDDAVAAELNFEPPNALAESPSKANELPLSTPSNHQVAENATPQSVVEREKAGAQAVSKLLSSRSAKAAQKVKPITYGRASANHARRERARLGKLAKSRDKVPNQLKPHSGNEVEAHGVRSTDQDFRKRSVTPAAIVEDTCATNVLTDAFDLASPENHHANDIIAPRRVFALFKGTYNAFYTATWTSTSADKQSYQVVFDDTTVTTIDAKHVCRLELRTGDQVKVDGPGWRNKTWIVNGLLTSQAALAAEASDIFGHTHVRIRAKSTRTSSSGEKECPVEELHEVPVSSVYLTHTMWTPFENRVFQPPITAKASRPETPSVGAQTPDVETPTGRNARSRVPTVKALDQRIKNLRDEPTAPHNRAVDGWIFDGMVFAISYVATDIEATTEKSEVTQLITRNRGRILEDGFEELFTLPDMDCGDVLNKKSSTMDEVSEQALCLKPECLDLGFVALIGDHHSRRAKYMQALALDLPTLSGRWIIDCVKASRNASAHAQNSVMHSQLPPWKKYLLPAGESNFLRGAIHSRTLVPYLPRSESAKLRRVVAQRPTLLKHEGLLMVAPKKGTAGWDRRKTYVFLTYALGAGRFRRVGSIQEAKALLKDEVDGQAWKWVYVDCDIAEAAAVLFDRPRPSAPAGGGGGKRRKRTSTDGSSQDLCGLMSATDGNIKLVNDEFVVQSLVLGDLAE